jgi:hypothetical protein
MAFFNAVLLGIAFSLVPSAMWPSVPKIIPEKQIGSALCIYILDTKLWTLGDTAFDRELSWKEPILVWPIEYKL